MMTETKTKIRDLGLLEISTPLRIILIPSDSKRVIVNHSTHGIRVSCSIAEQEREVRVARLQKKVKISTPPLLFSVCYADIPRPRQNCINSFYIFGFYSRNYTTIWAAPYVLSNVYPGGRICFGSVHPWDLRSAYNYFWEAGFNADLRHHTQYVAQVAGTSIEYNTATSTVLKNYQKEIFDAQDWENMTDFIYGSRYWMHTNPAEGILATNHTGLLKQIPKKYWLKKNGEAFLIARAKRHKNYWVFNNDSIKFKVPAGSIAVK